MKDSKVKNVLDPPEHSGADGVATAALEVTGMTCASCVLTIETALLRVPGVLSSSVSLALERATVQFDPSASGPQELVQAVEDVGFEAEVLPVDDDGDAVPVSQDVRDAKVKAAMKRASRSLAFSLLFSVPLFVLAMAFHGGGGGGHHSTGLFKEVAPGLDLMSILQWGLATPVQFVSGAPFYRLAAKDVKNRALGMNFLIAGGTSAAYLYSLVMLVLGISRGKSNSHQLFFETSAVLISFVLLGKLLELLAKGKASDAVGKLMKLRADTALLVKDWPQALQEENVPAEALRPGHIVKIIRGSKMPADGVVVRGSAALDESMLTGESMPVHRGEGAKVLGSTLCNEGLCHVRVTHTGKATALHQIISLVEKAQGSKAPIQELGDRVAAVFVPMVLALAGATLVIWLSLCLTGAVPEEWYRDQPGSPSPFLFSFMFALAVLVIACPCAVGLATPTAVMVGTGVAASHGLLIKGGAVLQKASGLATVVFDKTGTLTLGKPKVATYVLLSSRAAQACCLAASSSSSSAAAAVTSRGLLRLVASAEQASEHPLARALVDYAKAVGLGGVSLLPVEDGTFQASSGRGLKCRVGGFKVAAGSPAYLRGEGGVIFSPNVEKAVRWMEGRGQTVVAASVEGQLCGLFGLIDTIRPEAPGAISALGRMGVKVWMLTGDNARAAAEVARRLGIPPSRVCAEVLPEDKAGKVAQLQQVLASRVEGQRARSKVLMRSELGDVITALDLTRTIFQRIKLNFLWALGYNTLGLPIAAGLFFPAFQLTLPPELAGAAMAMSSVSVVLSSLALRLYRPPRAAKAAIATAVAARSAAQGRAAESPAAVGEGEGKGVGEGEGGQPDGVVFGQVDLDCDCKCCQLAAEAKPEELLRQLDVGGSGLKDSDHTSGGGAAGCCGHTHRDVLGLDAEQTRLATSACSACGVPAPAAMGEDSSDMESRALLGHGASSSEGGGTLGLPVGLPGGVSVHRCECSCTWCGCMRATEP